MSETTLFFSFNMWLQIWGNLSQNLNTSSYHLNSVTAKFEKYLYDSHCFCHTKCVVQLLHSSLCCHTALLLNFWGNFSENEIRCRSSSIWNSNTFLSYHIHKVKWHLLSPFPFLPINDFSFVEIFSNFSVWHPHNVWKRSIRNFFSYHLKCQLPFLCYHYVMLL